MALIKYLGLRLSNPKNLYKRNTTESISSFELIEPQKLLHSLKSAEKYYDTDLSISHLKVNRRIGRHCEAEAKLNLVIHKYDVTDKKPSISEIVDCFTKCGAEIFACTYDDGETNVDVNKEGDVSDKKTVAEKYYVIDTDMECELKKESTGNQLDVNLTLKMSSWDYFLDRKPYCKVYLNKKLGVDVMQGIVDKYKENKQGWKIDISGIQNICFEKSQPKNSEEKNSEEKVRVELTQPYLVQYNETEYQFLLRNANRCGEFLFFEDGKLNYGLKKNANGNTVVNEKLDDYDSVKSLDNKSQFDQKNEYFMRNGCNYGDFRKPDSVKKERPFVAEYANDEYFRPIKKDDYDAYYEEYSGSENIDVTDLKNQGDFLDEKWGRIGWKAANVILSNQDTLGKMVEDCISLGMNIAGLEQRKVAGDNNENYNKKYFPDSVNGKAESQYAKDNKFFSQFSELYTDEELCDKYGNKQGKYENRNKSLIKLESRPSTDLFFRMEENERTVASSQYRLTYHRLVEVGLGDILQLKSISSQKFVVVDVQSECGLEEEEWNNKTIVTVVPGIDKGEVKFYPLPAEVEMVRKSGPQTACVVDNADPLFQGRVRIKYYWQQSLDKVDDASPWVRVSYPYATKGSGIYSKLTVGDEVMVNYVNDNIELPYVSGAVYGMDNKVPFNTRTYSQVIRSSNGHMIGVTEGRSAFNFWSGIIPCLPLVKIICSFAGARMIPSDGSYLKKLIGGIVIRDTYGLYQIKASSDERKISISSPFGEVTIDAFTGITLSAPNGDINIKGKNVNIVANNNLTLKSGENIEELLFAKRKDDSLLPTFDKIVRKAEDKLWSKTLDMSYLRNIFEVFVRPVEGTLEIKSNRYLILNSGKGNATVPKSAYSKTSGVEACEKRLYDKINEVTYWQRDCADVLLNYYHELYEKRMKVMNDFIEWRDSTRVKSRHHEFAKKLLKNDGVNKTNEQLEQMIDGYINGTQLFEIPDNMPKTLKKLRELQTEYTDFWTVGNNSKCFVVHQKKDERRVAFYKAVASCILNAGSNDENLKLFKSPEQGFMLEPKLIKRDGTKVTISNLMRREISKVANRLRFTLVSSTDDKTWQKNVDAFITELQDKVTKSKEEDLGYMPDGKYLRKSLKENSAHRFWTAKDARFAWQKDAMGQILMSQDKGKTLTFNGAVVHENSNSSVEQLRTLLLSPPVTASFMVGQDSSDGEAKSEAIQELQKMVDDKLSAQKDEVKAALDKMKPANKQVEKSNAIVSEVVISRSRFK